MKRSEWIIIPGLLAVVGAILVFSPGFEEPGCACEPPPSFLEVQAWAKLAGEGDYQDNIRAMRWAWRGYGGRKDEKQADYWMKRAVAAGDPETLYMLADHSFSRVNDEPDPVKKLALIDEALGLLEQGYPKRAMLEDTGRDGYVRTLRDVRAAQAVMRDGLAAWLAKAEAGDATAMHHVARYYLNVSLDQDKRSYWEARAAKAGEPEIANDEACCWRETRRELFEGKRLIAAARNNPVALQATGDIWIQAILLEQLDATERQIDQRLAKLQHL